MEFLKLGSTKESNEEILGRGLMEEEGKGQQRFKVETIILFRQNSNMSSYLTLFAENADITSALSKLTEPTAAVPISKLSVSNMVHSARKHIRRHRRDESPLNTNLLNSILLVSIIRIIRIILEFGNVCVLRLDILTLFLVMLMLRMLYFYLIFK